MHGSQAGMRGRLNSFLLAGWRETRVPVAVVEAAAGTSFWAAECGAACRREAQCPAGSMKSEYGV